MYLKCRGMSEKKNIDLTPLLQNDLLHPLTLNKVFVFCMFILY